jgi:hypothetical protein
MGSSKKSDTPDAPDYTGAAQQTAAGNLEAARAAASANRVNQYTPYGNLIYSQVPGGSPDQWQSRIDLSPTGQALLDQSNQTSLGMGNLQNQAVGRVGQSMSQPFDYSSVNDVRDDSYKAYTSRLDPQWNQRQAGLENQLSNQGIQRGSEAYSNAMRDFDTGRNDAYQQAIQGSIATMPQTYQMAQALRSQPLNELNALRTGSQVQNPQFQTPPQQATTSGPNYLGAAQAGYQGNLDAYNASTGSSNSMMGGLFGLGSGIFGAAGNAGGFGNLFGF